MLQTDIVANMISCNDKGDITVTPVTRKEMYKQPMEGQDMTNHINLLNAEYKEQVLEVVAKYHYRNGERQHDNSMGTIKITHKELTNELAKMFRKGGLA